MSATPFTDCVLEMLSRRRREDPLHYAINALAESLTFSGYQYDFTELLAAVRGVIA